MNRCCKIIIKEYKIYNPLNITQEMCDMVSSELRRNLGRNY